MDRLAKLAEMLVQNPADSFLRHAMALEHIKAGRDGTARALFEAILAHDPGYTGSYYHLGKLLERSNDAASAAAWYERGIEAARAAGDAHSLGELQAALDDLNSW